MNPLPEIHQDSTDIAIIGAGAAGLMAGIFAARSAPSCTRVVLLDGAKKPGAKILIAGGGRCNVTHDVVHAADYAGGASGNTVKKVLKSFPVEKTTAFFAELGVELKREDTGKLFPTTNKARTVLEALLGAVADSGAELRADHRVTKINLGDAGFEITTNHGTLHARRVILATGGKALPTTGSDGFGYTLAKHLGHTVTDTWPALVPLLLPEGHWLTTVSGIAFDVELVLAAQTGKIIHRQTGAMLATHFGVSGPAAMDISRHLVGHADAKPKLTANLFPGETFDTMDRRLVEAAQHTPNATMLSTFRGKLPERVLRALVECEAGFDPTAGLHRVTREQRRQLARALIALPLPITGDRGYKFAEVTAGGVPMTEIQTATMASKPCEGLYLCGEILDVDGRIGGYNFQWAWCTGRLAGMAAANVPAP